jgi:hypothetical protein
MDQRAKSSDRVDLDQAARASLGLGVGASADNKKAAPVDPGRVNFFR